MEMAELGAGRRLPLLSPLDAPSGNKRPERDPKGLGLINSDRDRDSQGFFPYASSSASPLPPRPSHKMQKTKKPDLFWVSAVSPLLVVIIGGAVAYAVHGENEGIPTVNLLLIPLSITSSSGLHPAYRSNTRFRFPGRR